MSNYGANVAYLNTYFQWEKNIYKNVQNKTNEMLTNAHTIYKLS